jgi:PKD repeat protein
MWDPTKYLNIYVYTLGGGVLGFAYPNGMQAVHITDGAFGNTSGSFNLGRTATHEVGHHFNLSHIWGDATCGNDGVADTPPAQTSNGGCPSHPYKLGTCAGNTTGEMTMNYMDYTNDACMNAFTAGQKARMTSAINAVRPALVASSATNCAVLPLDAIFSANVTTINVGQSVTFTDASTGPNTITSWNWNFDVTGIGGATASTASTVGPHNVTYNTAGLFTVSLLVGDGSPTDTETKPG